MTTCHSSPQDKKPKPDWLLYSSLSVIAAALLLHLSPLTFPALNPFGQAVTTLLKTMWWGIVSGLLAAGLMKKVPREYFTVLFGRGDTTGGLLRAAGAGVLLDLCNHGILLVAAQLYERGVSLAQVMTFLIASPWNSFTLTLILISLIGLPWTLAFIAGSVVIAVLTGLLYITLTKQSFLPKNPHTPPEPEPNFDIIADAKTRLKISDSLRPS